MTWMSGQHVLFRRAEGARPGTVPHVGEGQRPFRAFLSFLWWIEKERVDPVSTTSETIKIHLPGAHECQVFEGAIIMRRDGWERHQPVCDTLVTVYQSLTPAAGTDVVNAEETCLRVVVYCVKIGTYAQASIYGFADLRQVMKWGKVPSMKA